MAGLILADDLSGLLDAAAAFHCGGANVKALLEPQALVRFRDDAVLAVTTETRNASPRFAAAAVENALATARAGGRELWFKKIDSTLRGPVAAELAALAAALPRTRILFAPANPAAGRTVQQGMLHVHGVPVAETEYGRDPASPVRTSSLHELLGSLATREVVIPDVETQNDLVAAVARMNADGDAWIGVGSGALARAIAQQFATSDTAAPRLKPPALLSRATLMVCGSNHPLNRLQAERLHAVRGVSLHEVNARDHRQALQPMVSDSDLGSGAAILLQPDRVDSKTALASIVAQAAKLVIRDNVQRIFVTGGETAFALCRLLGIDTLEFLFEIEPGVSVSYGNTPRGPLLIAIKPGGFGDAATWIKVWDRLREM